MTDRRGGGVGADQMTGDLSHALELGELVLTGCRLTQSPVQVHLIVSAAIALPDAAGAHCDRDRTEQWLELGARGFRVLVALDRERVSLGEVRFTRAFLVLECAQRRAEYHRLRVLRGAVSNILGDVAQILVEVGRIGRHRLDAKDLVFTLVEGAQRNHPGLGVAKDRLHEDFNLIAVDLQYLRTHQILPPISM
jgi:hypothetical protein